MSMNKIKKRKRKEERPATHPRNKYSENPPDFAHLASLYPLFPALGLRLSRRSSQNRLDRLQRHLGTHLGPPPPRPTPQLFDFCMCNPPFSETMEEAGLNPKTACGEKAFITRIIEDSITLKHTFRWYTSIVGRKLNVKILTSKLWEVGVTMVKTTEFVQSQTSRWGLAWSFLPPANKLLSSHVAVKNNLSFMLEITLTKDHSDAILKGESQDCDRVISCEDKQEASTSSSSLNLPSIHLGFRVLFSFLYVFQENRGTLLVKGSLQQRDSQLSGEFSPIFQRLEEDLKQRFFDFPLKICKQNYHSLVY
ncbi:unnamed protein product [Malus baccata var. baccata]